MLPSEARNSDISTSAPSDTLATGLPRAPVWHDTVGGMTDDQKKIREMLDKAIKISAELVALGLLGVKDAPWTEIRVEYSRKLLGMFLGGHANHQLVFMRIWQIEPAYLTNAFRYFYDESNLNITRILDVAQDLKVGFPFSSYFVSLRDGRSWTRCSRFDHSSSRWMLPRWLLVAST